MKSKAYSLLKFLIGWPFSLIALFFIIQAIAPQREQIFSNLTQINPLLLTYGIGCFVLYYFIRSYLWHRLAKGYGYNVAFKNSCYLWATSELKRYIPGNIWSLLGRTILFSEKGMTKKDIGACLIFEAELFVIGAALVSLLALPFLLPGKSGLLQISIVLLAGAGSIAYMFNKRITAYLPKALSTFLFPPFRATETGLCILISSVGLFFFGLGNYLIVTSFVALNPQEVIMLTGFFVFSFLIGYLSILTPAGLGVREGIIIWGLSRLIAVSEAAFASLFSRIILMLAEVIFISFAFIWHRSRNRFIAAIESWVSMRKHETIVWFGILLYSIYFTTASFFRYDNFYTGRYDLGNMAQTVWNTMHGRIFVFLNPDGTEILSRLSAHADFILILLAPFYLIWDDPRMLLLIQTVVVACGAYFVFRIAQHILKNNTIALVFAFSYLLNPSVQRANLYDFHAVVLATTFLLATYYFYLKKRYALFLLFAVLTGICKEQLWVIIAIFGMFLVIQHKKYVFGGVLTIASLGFFYYLVSVAIPQSLGSEHFALSYYSQFGESPQEVIKTVLFSPDKIIATIMQKEQATFLKQLLLPLGYLSLLAPVFMIFATPELLLSLLSNNAQMHQIYYQYTAAITPFLFIAAIYSIRYFRIFFPRIPFALFSGYIIVMTIYGAYLYGPLPGARSANLDMFTKPLSQGEQIRELIARIPETAHVAASNNIASHLSHREYIYVLPQGLDKNPDFIVFLHAQSESSDKIAIEQEVMRSLERNPLYTKTAELENFVMFSKREK